jgi:hypothetical protein
MFQKIWILEHCQILIYYHSPLVFNRINFINLNFQHKTEYFTRLNLNGVFCCKRTFQPCVNHTRDCVFFTNPRKSKKWIKDIFKQKFIYKKNREVNNLTHSFWNFKLRDRRQIKQWNIAILDFSNWPFCTLFRGF